MSHSPTADLLESPQEAFRPHPASASSPLKANVDCEDEIALSHADELEDCYFDDEVEDGQHERSFLDSFLSSLERRDVYNCSVSVRDVFSPAPLSTLLCYGCARPYGPQDEVSVDVSRRRMFVVCGQCRWWATRRIDIQEEG